MKIKVRWERCDQVIIQTLDDLCEQGYNKESLWQGLGYILGDSGIVTTEEFRIGVEMGFIHRSQRSAEDVVQEELEKVKEILDEVDKVTK